MDDREHAGEPVANVIGQGTRQGMCALMTWNLADFPAEETRILIRAG